MIVFAQAGPGSSGAQADQWLYLAAPLGLYAVLSLALFATGRTDENEPNLLKFFFRQISDSLHRITGLAGWSMAGVLTGLMMLLIAVIGFYWDVAWHIDNGRDRQLFTVPHVMILVGLGGLIFAAGIATLFATFDRAQAGFRLLGFQVPWSALGLASLGIGGVAAFPFDNLWHKAYGLDVTLWSPTHLQLVGGGSLGTLALWLMFAEGLPGARPRALARVIHVTIAGAALVAMSTFQGEFDFGVPQFQLLYLPLLIAAAAGFALVVARIALGPGGALWALFTYLILRGMLGLIVGGALGHTFPRFPLYLASALAVEGAAFLVSPERRLHFGLAAGAAVGTVGLAGELVVGGLVWGIPGTTVLLPKIALLGPPVAVAAALLGAGLGQAFGRGSHPVPLAALAGAAAVLIAAMAYPLPRDVGKVSATIRLDRTDAPAIVEVVLDPPGAAKGAVAFGVGAWQGGGTVLSPLREVAPGRYVSIERIPVTGRWKSMVGLQRGSEVMAAPIYLPADPQIGASEVPAVPERTTRFVRNTSVLLREAHPGPPWPAMVVYLALTAVVSMWLGLLSLAAVRIGRQGTATDVATPQQPAPAWTPAATWSTYSG